MIVTDLSTILGFLEKNILLGLSQNLTSNTTTTTTTNTTTNTDTNTTTNTQNNIHIDLEEDNPEDTNQNIMVTTTLSSTSTSSSTSVHSSTGKNQNFVLNNKFIQYSSQSTSYFLLSHIVILIKEPLGSELFLASIQALYGYAENHRNEAHEVSLLMIAVFKLREDGGAYTVNDIATNTTYQSRSLTDLPIQAILLLTTTSTTTTAATNKSKLLIEGGLYYTEPLLKQVFSKNPIAQFALSKSAYKTATEAKV